MKKLEKGDEKEGEELEEARRYGHEGKEGGRWLEGRGSFTFTCRREGWCGVTRY